MLISAIWRIIIVNVPAVWFNLRFAMLLKTAWAIGRPPGIYGVTIGYLFHGRPYRTGWKQREKKTEVEVKIEYIDDALSEFSGYIAADELYDGPFCVLFIVENRKFNRLYYEVLDHNPTHEDMTAFCLIIPVTAGTTPSPVVRSLCPGFTRRLWSCFEIGFDWV